MTPARAGRSPKAGRPQTDDAAYRQPVDPVLDHLLLAARSDAVCQEFFAGNSVEELEDEHELTLLARPKPSAAAFWR